MLLTIDRLPERIEAACCGALAAESAAGAPAGADDFLQVAEALGEGGRLDDEDLRARGLGAPPLCGPPGALLRTLPVALLVPLDRPRLRRDVRRCALVAAADPATVIAAVAAALLTADLLRFDLDTALMRVHQSLLEEAPTALLRGLRALGPAEVRGDDDPIGALQVAITALGRSRGVPAVVALLLEGGGLRPALTLAAVLAAARDGLLGCEEGWIANGPDRDRALVIAGRLGERAVAEREDGAAGPHPREVAATAPGRPPAGDD